MPPPSRASTVMLRRVMSSHGPVFFSLPDAACFAGNRKINGSTNVVPASRNQTDSGHIVKPKCKLHDSAQLDLKVYCSCGYSMANDSMIKEMMDMICNCRSIGRAHVLPGSIILTTDSAQVIDLEFAFYAPWPNEFPGELDFHLLSSRWTRLSNK
ncbi:uncharacterized protein LOC127763410 [Oryza glaberrima]|uniref:uncharacterized protein LOC127763410 n=1 Tax=Oryza glaberrima TaxID=4538 RepID=UPI00224C08D9|nr:uncharacterized protein LOC127763410 [Oryza glaberrima]